MSKPPELTDQIALARNRAGATVDFLHREAISEIKERLAAVNRRFRSPAVVTGFPEVWRDAWPDAEIAADEKFITLGQGSHDLVVHGLSLHWVGDLVGHLIQCRRALKPDGLFLGVLFGGQTLTELRTALAEAEARVTGGISPRVLPMSEIRDLGSLLQRAGFALPVADSLTLPVQYDSPWHLMRDLRAMGEGNALAARLRQPSRKALFAEAARIYVESYGAQDGTVPATFEMIFLAGWAPDGSQQKPLKPGSAKVRLSDALGTQENALPGLRDD